MTNAVQFSTKYGDEIYVVGGATFNEAKRNLDDAIGSVDADAVVVKMASAFAAEPPAWMSPAPVTTAQAVSNLGQAFPEAAAAGNNWAGTDAVPAAPAYRAPAGPPPGYAPPMCGPSGSHGPMVHRTGTSARGPWSAHFCSFPKNHPEQCKPIFGS